MEMRRAIARPEIKDRLRNAPMAPGLGVKCQRSGCRAVTSDRTGLVFGSMAD